MENQQGGAVYVAPRDGAAFGQRPIKVRNELHQGTLFDNRALIELLTRYPLPILAAAMAKVRYPGLDLKHFDK